jgi:transcription antitermination factor NusG
MVAAVAAAEIKIAAEIRLLSLHPYVPRYQVRQSVRGRIMRRAEVMLPGYVLIRWTRRWQVILRVRGVVEILGVSRMGKPGRVPHDQVKRIRDMEDEHGFVVLSDDPKTLVTPEFRNGDVVLIGIGAFAGRSAVYQHASRGSAAVELVMGGATVSALVPHRGLLPA